MRKLRKAFWKIRRLFLTLNLFRTRNPNRLPNLTPNLLLLPNRTQRRNRTRLRMWTRTRRKILRKINRLWKLLPWTWILLSFLLALAAWMPPRMK